MNQSFTTIVSAVEPRGETVSVRWLGWTATFFELGMFVLMAYIAARGIVRRFSKAVEDEEADGGEIEKFKQYKETWNKVAKDCIAMGRDCDKLERSIGIKPSKHEDTNKSKLNGKRDEKDPVMPDNQEWGEW